MTVQRSDQNHLLTYENAPVAEVVASVQFSEIQNLKAAHVYKFWKAIGAETLFPKNEEHPPLAKIQAPSDSFLVMAVDKPILNRQWFISEDESALVQFQNDRLVCNWRRIPGKPYPRYGEVIGKLYETLKGLTSFIEAEKWPVLRYEQLELSYVNIIPFTDFTAGENLGEIGTVFKDITWASSNRFLTAPNRLRMQWQFPLPSFLSMGYVTIDTVQNVTDAKPAIRLVINAMGASTGQDSPAMKSWFDSAHEWIVQAFDDIVTKEMKMEWGRQ